MEAKNVETLERKPTKVDITILHHEVGIIRSRAAVVVAHTEGKPEQVEAHTIERRAAAIERRLAVLVRQNRRKFLIVMTPWKMADVEKSLDDIGATTEDRTANTSMGGGRNR